MQLMHCMHAYIIPPGEAYCTNICITFFYVKFGPVNISMVHMRATQLNCIVKESVILYCLKMRNFADTIEFRENKFTLDWINIRENATANIIFQPKHGQIF